MLLRWDVAHTDRMARGLPESPFFQLLHFCDRLRFYQLQESTLTDLFCLALIAFHEARGEPKQCQEMIAEVAINRSIDNSSSICSVMKQKGQFSFVGKKSLSVPTKEKESWDLSIKIAQSQLHKKTNYSKGSRYFNHKRMGARFGKKKKAECGSHVFF